MKRISIKSLTIVVISLVMTGCWTYKHEGFLDATTPNVPAGLLKGYYVRRFSVNFESDETSFRYGRSIVNAVSERNRNEMVRMMRVRYPEIIKNSQGIPIDIIVNLRSENFDLSIAWYLATMGILPGCSTCATDCEIIVSTDRWRGSQNLRFRSESAVTACSPLALCALEEPDKLAVSKHKDWLLNLFPGDIQKSNKSMRSVFAETLADTVVHIIKTAELKEFENNKKGN